MESYKIVFESYNQPVLIGRFMLIFSRRRIAVTDFSYQKKNEEEGIFTIAFDSNAWQAENLLKQVQKQIDVFTASLHKI